MRRMFRFFHGAAIGKPAARVMKLAKESQYFVTFFPIFWN